MADSEAPKPTPAEIVKLLRLVAAGRADYAQNAPKHTRALLLAESAAYGVAADIADGDRLALFGLLPSWRWSEAGLATNPRD